MLAQSQEMAIMGLPLKHVSLITLTFQNSALILLMHYSRIMPQVGTHRYITSTAVLLNEIIKLAVSLTIALYDISYTLPPGTPATVLFEQLYNSVFSGDGWKLAIPAALYTFQNSLQYVAVSNLDAVHFQILYQLKILTTALFSVTMLQRSLSTRRWIALVILTVGVAIVQLPTGHDKGYRPVYDPNVNGFAFPRSLHELGQMANDVLAVTEELTRRSFDGATGAFSKRSATYEGIHADQGMTRPRMNYSLGCSAVLIASVVSGLTGVYFEKVLKNANDVSVWIRNVQLSFYSIFPALFVGVLIKDGEDIAQQGFFAGYNSVVWTAIMFQALGGILVAMCINYADNIAKNFATSISIILSCLVSIWFFDFTVTSSFLVGTVLVLYAIYLYSLPDFTKGRPPPISIIDYEKSPMSGASTPRIEEGRSSFEPLLSVKSVGLSTSRPSSPMRHHARPHSSRGRDKRYD